MLGTILTYMIVVMEFSSSDDGGGDTALETNNTMACM